jgi:hypothetical protein
MQAAFLPASSYRLLSPHPAWPLAHRLQALGRPTWSEVELLGGELHVDILTTYRGHAIAGGSCLAAAR